MRQSSAGGPLQRAYLAIVWGAPRRAHGTITTPIERSNKNREKMMVVGEDRGREAITHYTVIERYPPLLKGGEETEALASLVECRLVSEEVIEGVGEIQLNVDCLWSRPGADGQHCWSGFHIIDLADDQAAALAVLLEHI